VISNTNRPRAKRPITSYTIDFILILGDVFILNLCRLNTELYIVSLYKINRILESYDKPPTKEVIAKVLAAY
jgi:hypothetical protein